MVHSPQDGHARPILTGSRFGDATARLAREAAGRIGSAGGRALARGDIPAAVELLERAIALLPETDLARADLALKLSLAFAETGEPAKAEALLSERLGIERRGRHFLAFVDGSARQRAYTLRLEKSPVSVGRSSGNDLSLPWDGDVSRRHAELRWDGAQWMVSDTHRSRNGSFVNGQRVSGQHPLADGDVLRVGHTSMLYRAPGSAVHAIPPDESGATTTRSRL